MNCCHCGDTQPCAAKIEIFRQLDGESQQRISALALHRRAKRGEILSSPGNAQGLYLISEGKVKIYELSANGKENLLRVPEQGDFFGEEALFGTGETCTFAQALTELQVCLIPRQAFLGLLMDYPTISIRLLEELNRRLVRLTHQRLSHRPAPVAARLAAYLLELFAAEDRRELVLPMQRKELAGILDTTPETLSRRMKELEEAGLIRREKNRLILRDIPALKKLSE